eukprot:2403446-Pleurochrysis_carterae.AAC.1
MACAACPESGPSLFLSRTLSSMLVSSPPPASGKYVRAAILTKKAGRNSAQSGPITRRVEFSDSK